MLSALRYFVSDRLKMKTVERFGTRMDRNVAPIYERYYQECRKNYKGTLPPIGEMADAVEQFSRDGVAGFVTDQSNKVATSIFRKMTERTVAGQPVWTDAMLGSSNQNYNGDIWRDFPELEELFRGDLGTFLQWRYGCDFKIFICSAMQSHRLFENRIGSQMWHSDAGPGPCTNLMMYLHDTDSTSGVLHVAPWDVSKDIFRREPKAVKQIALVNGITQDPHTLPKEKRRELLEVYYEAEMGGRYADRVYAPSGRAGLIVAFRNNNLHRGGFPLVQGKSRAAFLMHVYPSDHPTDYDLYRQRGVGKPSPYPKDPAFT